MPSGQWGHDAADSSCHQKNIFGAICLEPVIHSCLVAKIELSAASGEDVGEALPLKMADDGGTDEPTVTGNVDGRV